MTVMKGEKLTEPLPAPDALLREALERLVNAMYDGPGERVSAREHARSVLAATPPASAERCANPDCFWHAAPHYHDYSVNSPILLTTPPASAERDAVVEAAKAWYDDKERSEMLALMDSIGMDADETTTELLVATRKLRAAENRS